MRESLILITIGLVDLWFTLQLMAGRQATEGNPLMAYYLQFGVGAFVIMKLVLLLLPVFVAEWSKLYKPEFVRWMLRGAIAAYLGMYLVGFAIYNVRPIMTERNKVPVNKVVKQVTIAEAQRNK
jgi:hypothetical protein